MAETDKKDFTAQQIKMKEIHKPSSFEGLCGLPRALLMRG